MAGSAGLVAHTLTLAKVAGASGLQILKVQPYLGVAILTTGTIFVYGCGVIVGNNTIRKDFGSWKGYGKQKIASAGNTSII